MAETREQPLTPKQQARRQRVIDAARRLAAGGGYDAVQMREVSDTADVALGTIYRYFSSKDHLLAAVMGEWTSELQERVLRRPPKGETLTEQMVDVYRRACRSMEREPQLSAAVITALSSPEAGPGEIFLEVRGRLAAIAGGILGELDEEVQDEILTVVGHVWYSTLVSWAHGRYDFARVVAELETAIRLVLRPYDDQVATAPASKAPRRTGRSRTAAV